LRAAGGDARRLGAARVGAIGPATAARLRAHGIEPDLVPEEHRGEALAEAVLARHGGDLRGVSVLLARAAVARDALPDALREAGARVEVVAAYRTLPPEPDARARLLRSVERGGLDAVTFTSSSTVENTLAALGPDATRLLAGSTIASIGPITTATAERHGLRVAVTAEQFTVPGLIRALERHFQETQP
jgi:uroporphyrinogen III methyltransferase/synthase